MSNLFFDSFLSLLAFFGLLASFLDSWLSSVLDFDRSLVLQLRHVRTRCGDAQNTVRGERRTHLVNVALLGNHISSLELTRYVSVLVQLFLVFRIYHHELVNDLDVYFVGLELLDVQIDLEKIISNNSLDTDVKQSIFFFTSMNEPRNSSRSAFECLKTKK